MTLIDGDELGRALAGIGIVGMVDGEDVIRRDSVLDLVRRRVLSAAADAAQAAQKPQQGPEQPD